MIFSNLLLEITESGGGKIMKTFWNIIKSIVVVPLCIIGAICITPFAMIYLLIDIPASVLSDIWEKDKNDLDKGLY